MVVYLWHTYAILSNSWAPRGFFLCVGERTREDSGGAWCLGGVFNACELIAVEGQTWGGGGLSGLKTAIRFETSVTHSPLPAGGPP